MPKIIVKTPEGDRTNKEHKMKEVIIVARKLAKLWNVEIGKTNIIPGFFPTTPECELLDSLDCSIEIYAWDLPGREESKEIVKALFIGEILWCNKVSINLQPPGLYKEC